MPTSHHSQIASSNAALERVHLTSADLLVHSMLPAIQVAWADGEVQPAERTELLAIADQLGLSTVPGAMARLEGWFQTPPTAEELHAASSVLTRHNSAATSSGGGAANALRWARSVARADGGVFGVGAISGVEARTLRALERALPDDANAVPFNGRTLLRFTQDFIASRSVPETSFVDQVPKQLVSELPVPSPIDPERMPPAVFAISDDEYERYMDLIVERYLTTLKSTWFETARFACTTPGVAPMTDPELERLVFKSPFSRFIVPTLDPSDLTLFSAVLEAHPQASPTKIDFSHFASWTPLEGIQVAPTVTLLDLTGPEPSVLAIAVRERVFCPGDQESWRRARYFFLQGASTALVVGIHPCLHFPMNSVIAVSRAMLPPAHRVARLIEAHAYLHLPLDHGVLWNRRSAARNHQSEPYTCLAADWVHVFRSFADFYTGLPGNSGFSPYHYPMTSPAFPGPYGDFLRRYYDVVLHHCTRVADAGPIDPELTQWAARLHDLLPGFPHPDQLSEPGVLGRCLAGFVHSVAIWHSAEHHAYGQEPANRVPTRLRVPEPKGYDPETDPRTWMSSVDLARQELCRKLFFQDHPIRGILEIEYGFEEPELVDAQQRFFEALRACEAAQPIAYIPLDRMACSIQY